MLKIMGKVKSEKEGKNQIMETIANGSALKKFYDMMVAQGVQENVAQELCKPGADMYKHLPLAKKKTELATQKTGVIKAIDALVVAEVSCKLGAGRQTQAGNIDHGVGLVLSVRVGQHVKKGEPWVVIYHNGNLTEAQKCNLQAAIQIDENGSDTLPVKSRIIDIIDSKKRSAIMVCQ